MLGIRRKEYSIFCYFRGDDTPYPCILEEGMSHILVFQRREYPIYLYFRWGNVPYTSNSETKYPIYLYFREQNIPYTCISEGRISHILLIRRTKYPIYWHFRWQNVPHSYKYVCVVCITILQRGFWVSAVPTESVLEHDGTQRSPVAIPYRGIGPSIWRKKGLLPHVFEQSISRSRCRLTVIIWWYGYGTTGFIEVTLRVRTASSSTK